MSNKITLLVVGGSAICIGIGIVSNLFLYFHKRKVGRISNMKVISGFINLILVEDEQKWIQETRDRIGERFIFSTGLLDFVNISNADDVKLILKNDQQLPKYQVPTSKAMDEVIGTNVVNSNGETWERHRVFVNPTFSFHSVQDFFETFVVNSNHLITKIESNQPVNSDSYIVNLPPLFTAMTMDVLSSTIFGFEFNSLKGENEEYVKAYTELMENFSNPIWVVFPFLEYLTFLPFVKRMRKSIEKMKELFDFLIKRHKENKKKGIESKSMLGMLMDSVYSDNPIVTEEELRSDMFIFFIAGHETTATALCWTVYFLSIHQEIQEELYQNIIQVLKGRAPTFDDLKEIPLLLRVIKESMRMEPPLKNLPTRMAESDIPLEDQNYVIPKNSIPNIMIRQIHHDPRYWSDPEVFDPNRFTADNSKGRHPYAYLPFSLGKRSCIGNNFSILEQEAVLLMLIQKYQILPILSVDQKPKIKRGMINAIQILPIQFKKRSQQ